VRHPDVRAISFTGSTATGNRIVQAAGLKKFSMELGGKSPFVIFDDADLSARARRRGVHDLQQQRRALHRRQPHPGAAASTPTSRRSSPSAPAASAWATRWTRKTTRRPDDQPAHLAKVRSYIELGPKEGATLLCGGLDRPYAAGAAPPAGNFVWPTVFADVDNRMRIAQEEIFGPVACLIPFDDEADAIASPTTSPTA
jgi:5-carboxymethyl-2-hydroxymuconic-semialdehyde dehydrogenase